MSRDVFLHEEIELLEDKGVLAMAYEIIVLVDMLEGILEIPKDTQG
jgi:hypothetical protein